jgi:2-dehydropantoate 2-reductase
MGCQIGGLVQRGGHEVTFIARGKQLEALQQRGLTLITTNDRYHTKVRAVATPQEAGTPDAVMLCTKSYQLPDVAPMVVPLLGPDTIVVPTVNGIPWWYFHKHGGAFDGRVLETLDPQGLLAKHIPLERVVGCVNYLAGTLTGPGEVHYVPELKKRLAIGEPDGQMTDRLQQLAVALGDGGFAPVVTDSIRTSIWHKLWGNIAFNPISALTHGTIDQIAEGYRDIDLVSAVMNEARFIADKLGIELSQTTKARVEAAAKMRGHKTSMLQDIEQGRATEIEAIVGVVREIGRWLEVGTPYLNALYSLVKLKEIFYLRAAGSPQA